MYLLNVINRANKNTVQPASAAVNEVFNNFFGNQSWLDFLFQKYPSIMVIWAVQHFSFHIFS